MQHTLTVHQAELSVFSKGLEAVIRKLVRFAVGNISLVKLQEMVSHLFVEEAEARLAAENPSGNAPLAQMALMTGLNTRAISRIRNSAYYRRGLSNNSEFLKDFTATANLLERWVVDPRFVDTRKGQPKPLKVAGPRESIEALAKSLGFGRGITPTAIVERLERSQFVRVDEASGLVHLQLSRYVPEPDRDREGSIEMGFASISRLMGTVLKNLDTSALTEDRLYQRAFWTIRLSPHRKRELREGLTELLKGFEKKAVSLIEKYDMTYGTPSQEVAGVGMYYFEGE